jgi:hypothetical protein
MNFLWPILVSDWWSIRCYGDVYCGGQWEIGMDNSLKVPIYGRKLFPVVFTIQSECLLYCQFVILTVIVFLSLLYRLF